MPDSHQHLTLGIGVLNLLHFDDLFFVEDFDGVETAIML